MHGVLKPSGSVVVVGIDPDLGGAVAALRLSPAVLSLVSVVESSHINSSSSNVWDSVTDSMGASTDSGLLEDNVVCAMVGYPNLSF